MSGGFFDRVFGTIDKSSIVLEVLDARFPELTRNRQLEQAVVNKGKKVLLVLNKSDLISKRQADRIKTELSKEFPVVFVSCIGKQGSSYLRNAIGSLSRGEKCTVSVVGYPNTGKSSIINMLSGKHSARTSAKAGFTRGEQLIRVSDSINIFDTPGIIPFGEHDEFKLVLTGSKNIEKVSDPETVALYFMQWARKDNPELLKKLGLDSEKESEELLEDFAKSKNKLSKGGIPDTKTASVLLIHAWQTGKIKP